jgi:hypothetical protein
LKDFVGVYFNLFHTFIANQIFKFCLNVEVGVGTHTHPGCKEAPSQALPERKTSLSTNIH